MESLLQILAPHPPRLLDGNGHSEMKPLLKLPGKRFGLAPEFLDHGIHAVLDHRRDDLARVALAFDPRISGNRLRAQFALSRALSGDDRVSDAVNRPSLVIEHVVVFHDVVAAFKIARLDLLLGLFHRPGKPFAFQGFPGGPVHERHKPLDRVDAEQPHQLVVEREEELRRPGLALAPRAAHQLEIDAPRFVAFGSENRQPARRRHALTLGFGHGLRGGEIAGVRVRIGPLLQAAVKRHLLDFDSRLRERVRPERRRRRAVRHRAPSQRVRIPAEQDVRSPTRHVRRDGHRPEPSAEGHDRGLRFMVLRVQDAMLDAEFGQRARQLLRLLGRNGSREHRPSERVKPENLRGDRSNFLRVRTVDAVRVVLADHRFVRRNGQNLEVVDLRELLRGRRRGPGHSR